MSGMQVYNDSGTVQFDSADAAYGFVGKGTVLTGTNGIGVTDKINFSSAFQDGLPTFDTVAFSCTTSAVLGGYIGRAERNGFFIYAGDGNHTITYYLFRSYRALSAVAGAGLETFTPAGELSYSTAYRPLTIIAKHAVTNQYLNMSEYRGLPAGRDYAWITFGSVTRDMGDGSGSGGTVNPDGANAGARRAGDGYYLEEIRGSGLQWSGPINGGFLIADVTGL